MKKDTGFNICKKEILAVQDALELLKGKWKIKIIGTLIYYEEARFSEIEKMIGEITPKMLSKELKELEINKIVKRTEFDTPVSVKYELTTHGKSCKTLIVALYEWGTQHRQKIIDDYPLS
jgi:DNA-binding HxlR family transcriptional regulator